jgi:hypothetical protein
MNALMALSRLPSRRSRLGLIKSLIDISHLAQGLNKRTKHLPAVILPNKSLSCTK